MKTITLKFIFAILLLSQFAVTAQSIGKPTFQYIGMCARPPLDPNDPNSQPFDKFLVDFNINSLNLFGAGNKFFLEISNSSGSFANPVVVVQPTTITATPASLQFIVPSNFVGGENFKFRVKVPILN